MFIGTVIVAVILSISFSKILFYFIAEPQSLVNRYIIMSLIKDLIVVIIVHLTTLLLYSIQQRQVAVLENERLIAENIRIRYEVLKNQVDPHFLFNSLNTLDGLIGIDDDKAHIYVQDLSLVFRYAIGNKEVMHLSEELDFAESFAHLMKIRYGDNFSIEYNIDEKYKSWFIMPVSIQLLVENAVKHNVISTKYPLVITIETTPDNTIRVKNPIHLKNEAEQGEGIGLANLSERYDLLFQKEVSITQTDVFCVEIPLIKQFEPAKTNQI
jgi:LytS/YehU family sensor histidine kinase